MAIQLRQSLSLHQQLIMTPQLQQAIKLLQQSRLELLETIYQEMEVNPMLEEQALEEADEKKGPEVEAAKPEQSTSEVTVKEDMRAGDVDWDVYMSEYNTGWATSSFDGRETPTFESFTPSKTNLCEHLMWQFSMSDVNEKQKEIGTHIIGNLDKDGYLQTSLEEILELTGHTLEEVVETLNLIQNFDPLGVAARDTRECLLIQARFQGLEDTIIERIILEHLDKLETKKYHQIAKALSVPLPEVISAINVITRLEPKPGRTYSDEETIYISPDIYVFKTGDDYEIILNEDGLPKLRISQYYRGILSRRDSLADGTKEYIQEKIKSAAWLIKSIHQRQRTIYRVTESIIRFQRLFLDKGIAYLKPLVLRDVAEDIQMHESTISRVTTNKYVHTPQGVFELKYFFSSSINSLEGDCVASESVREHIRTIIKSENGSKPYSDQEVADLLRNLNINIARRTVAKYRETMGILPSRKRKKYVGLL